MRVSENMKSGFVISDINRTLARMVKTQRDLSTSKRIHKPSDDPTCTSRIIRLKGQIARYKRYQSSISSSREWLVSTEASLNTLLDKISDVNSILLQASNGDIGDVERDNLSERVKGHLNSILDLANKNYGGKYIFGGTETATPPYSANTEIEDEEFTSDYDEPVYLNSVNLEAGSVTVTDTSGSVTYTEGTDYTIDYENGSITVLRTGSMSDATDYEISYNTSDSVNFEVNPDGIDGEIEREIDEGVTIKINISGDDVFGGSDGLFKVLRDAYNALKRNDVEEIKSVRGDLLNEIDDVTRVLGEVGAKINRLDTLSQRIDTDVTTFRELISSVEDTDITEALVNLQNDRTVYEAALKTGASIIQSSLLDYL